MLKRMKNLGLILFLLLFAACGADGDGDRDALVGAWTAQTRNGSDVTLLGKTRTLDGTNFTEVTLICTKMTGTYTTSGDKITFTTASVSSIPWCGSYAGEKWTDTYTVDGNTLTLTTSGADIWKYTK